MAGRFSKWGPEDELTTPEHVAEYLGQVAEGDDAEEMACALGVVARTGKTAVGGVRERGA